MIHVWQQLAVHLSHLRPIGAVHVRHVEIVTLVPPTLIEDLFELFLRLEVHAQPDVEAALSRLRRISISVNDKERRHRRWSSLSRTTRSKATTTCRAINQLAAVGAYLV